MSEVVGDAAEYLDVWNSNTFGDPLRAELCEKRELIEEYHHEKARLEGLDRDEHLIECLRGNRYFGRLEVLQNRVADALTGRHIRVWHYTRLVDFEVATLRNAIELSNEERMKTRLFELKCRGHLSEQELEALLESSALNTQKMARENMFYGVSSPLSVTYSGVKPLLGHWGGEVVYFHQRDEVLLQKLGALGRPRVVELEVEISDPNLRYSLAGCILNTCALDLGFSLFPEFIDVCIREDPPRARVLFVHTEGEEAFHGLGHSYPDGAEVLSNREKVGARSLTTESRCELGALRTLISH